MGEVPLYGYSPCALDVVGVGVEEVLGQVVDRVVGSHLLGGAPCKPHSDSLAPRSSPEAGPCRVRTHSCGVQNVSTASLPARGGLSRAQTDIYWVTWLIRNTPLLGPYSSPMPRDLW